MKINILFCYRDTEIAVLPDGLLNTIKRQHPQVNIIGLFYFQFAASHNEYHHYNTVPQQMYKLPS